MTIILRVAATNLGKCLVKFFSAYPKKSLDRRSLQFRMTKVAIPPRNTLLYIMINKIKTAIVRAVVNSDTFKSTLENVVIKEVEFGIRENDDVVTHGELDKFMYQNDLIDRYDIDEKIESATQYFLDVESVQDMIDETELPDFVERGDIEDMISDALSAEDLKVCSAEKLRVACLRTLANLIEGAE